MKNEASRQSAQIEVYMDGQCPLCKWSRAHVEPFDRDKRIEWLDYHEPEALRRAAPHTYAEMSAEMHARDASGRWTQGFAAWVEIIRVLPRFRLLAPVLANWPFTKLGPLFYRWLAKRRYTIFGVPPPCDPETGVCTLHQTK